MWINGVMQWLFIVLHSILLFAVLKAISKLHLDQQNKRQLALPGPDIGKPIKTFTASDAVHGEEWNLQRLLGRPTYLFFFHPGCSGCQQMIPVVNQLITLEKQVNCVIFSRAGRAENLEWIEESGVQLPVLVDKGGEISLSLQINQTPYAVLLDANGLVVQKFVMMGTTENDLASYLEPVLRRTA